MSRSFSDITTALAALAQSCALITDIAYNGEADEKAYHSCIDSIFKIDAPSVSAVYGHITNVNYGFDALKKVLQDASDKVVLDMRSYFASLIHLERNFISDKKLVQTLSDGLTQIETKRDYFSPYHENVIFSLADLYKETIGSLSLTIKIMGRPEYLHVREKADQCRALLLAGIRAVVLWRQLGGSRWSLLFSRGKYINMCSDLSFD